MKKHLFSLLYILLTAIVLFNLVSCTNNTDISDTKENLSITGKIADLFAENENLILYYSCDDMNPIPSRNTKGANKDLSVQEYRSNLFTHMFNSYMLSHQVSGISNTPIIIKGEGYTQYMHLIARDKHRSIVDLVKEDIIEGWGK